MESYWDNWHRFFRDMMPFLSHSQQHWSTKGNLVHFLRPVKITGFLDSPSDYWVKGRCWVFTLQCQYSVVNNVAATEYAVSWLCYMMWCVLQITLTSVLTWCPEVSCLYWRPWWQSQLVLEFRTDYSEVQLSTGYRTLFCLCLACAAVKPCWNFIFMFVMLTLWWCCVPHHMMRTLVICTGCGKK